MTRRQRIDIRRFAASLVALVVMVALVPIGLASVASARFGSANPLAGVRGPWTWSASEVGDTLTHPLDDNSVVDALIRLSLCVIWVAVIVMVVTTVVEVVHMVRHGGLPMPSVRGVGWAQGVSQYIAVGLLLVMPLTSAKPSLATTRAPAFGAPRASTELVATPAPVSELPPVASSLPSLSGAYTVQRGDSVFSLAADLAGHDERRTMEIANEILDANLGSMMNDGQRFTNPAYIEPGWVLAMPAGARTNPSDVPSTPAASEVFLGTDPAAPAPIDRPIHVVQPGDTLWDIADDELGSGTEWVEIWEENAGDDMGGGRTFDDPNLIVPGWELDLPSELAPLAADESEPVGDPITGDPESGSEPSVAVAAPPSGEATTTTTTTTTSSAAAVAEIPIETPTASAATTSTTVAPSSTGTGSSNVSSERGVAPDAPSPIRFEHAAMLAAGILTLVGIRRRQRLRAARPRSRVPEPRADVIETELLLRRIDAGERATRIDVACRSAAFSLIDTDAQIVVIQVSTEGEIVLTLSAAVPAPSPWNNEASAAALVGSTWRLPAGVPIELLSDTARRVGMPCVALVQLGIDDDGNDVLIDVEACGTLAIDAHPAQADAVVRALAAGLASSQYAEVAQLITVSLGHDSLLGHRNAHCAESIDAAFDLAATLAGSTSTNERSSFELRSLRTGGEMWEPAVVLLHDADHAGTVLTACHQPRPGHGIGVVATVGPGEVSEAPARLVGEADRWDLAVAGRTIAMTPVGLHRQDLDAVQALLSDAEQPLIWMDDLVVVAPEAEPSTVAPTADADADVVVATLGDGTPDGVDILGSIEPAGAVEPVPPFEPMDHAIVVHLLGGVHVADPRGVPGVFERSKTVELIAWLATHRSHSTRGAARTALWELDVRDATFANVVSEARRGLGRLVTPPDGEEWLARTLTEQLPLHPWVVTDAQLVEERLEQARLEPPAQAIHTLRPAVDMITGMPFAGTSYLWPDAEGITSNLVLLAISASAELAGHALSIGDTELVFWATGHGLAVLPGHEELIALRMRAHARSGDLAGVRQEWESYERVIVADPWSDGEPAPKLLGLRRELLSSGGE